VTKKATALIHHPYTPPPGFASPAVPVHKGSTVFFDSVAAMRSRQWLDRSAYTYGLHGTPTSFTLEERIATLEGGTHTMLLSSGLAAVTMVDMALLKSGDQVLLPHNVYGPNKTFTRTELAAWGIGHAVYDAMDAASLVAAITPATKLVWLEAPGSVTLEFPNLRALVGVVRERAPQAVMALDNTWGAGIAFDAFALGIDITIHALTKYPSGGGDVLMGSVTCRDESLYRTLALSRSRVGHGVGINDVELVLRALPSMALRYAAQDAACRAFAAWCQTRKEFVRVLHPALQGSPGHEHWASHCTAAAGLVTVEVDSRYGTARTDAFVDALKLFRLGYSWAGPISLVVPYDPKTIRDSNSPYRGMLVRFCIGLEAVEDLIADAAQALAVLAA
jgi:cysteine-S-conjugate beta-lyase